MRLLTRHGCLLAALYCVLTPVCAAPAVPLTTDMDEYLAPYIAGNNFSGVVLVSRKGEVLFQKAYGKTCA